MSRILVTGGAGYIGSHFVKLAIQAGHEVYVIDNLSTGSRESVSGCEFHQIDLCEIEELDKLFHQKKIDSVIHFAGSVIVPDSVNDPIGYYKNNTLNSISLIELCLKYNVKKFIFSSTAAIYEETNQKVTENSKINPKSPYGKSKMMVEEVLKDVAKAHDIRFISFRYFNVAGADPSGEIGQQTENATHLIKVACQAALGKREKFEIFGTDYPTKDGTGVRDFVHVMDLVQAHLDGLNYLESNPSTIFNCGYGKGYSVREVVNIVKEISGNEFNVVESEPRAGDLAQVVTDITKIKNELSWKPKYDDLKEIIESAYNWEKKLNSI